MIAMALLKPNFTGTLGGSTEKVILKVSVSSISLSHITGIFIVFLISPGLNVTFNGSEAKSIPDPKDIIIDLLKHYFN